MGSEMCIRDSACTSLPLHFDPPDFLLQVVDLCEPLLQLVEQLLLLFRKLAFIAQLAGLEESTQFVRERASGALYFFLSAHQVLFRFRHVTRLGQNEEAPIPMSLQNVEAMRLHVIACRALSRHHA